jgi:hypothetical protein
MTARLPTPAGPFPIGLRQIEFTAGTRRAQAYVWYPALEDDSPFRPLNTPRESEAFAGTFAALGLHAHASHAGAAVLSNAREAATPRAGAWPLVVFNHGGALDPLANATLMEELASNGYVAASLGHPGESAGLVWKDGSISSIDAALIAAMQLPQEALGAFARMLLASDTGERDRYLADFRERDPGVLAALAGDWARDAVAFADLVQGPSPPAPLRSIAEVIDHERLAYAGMSLGGAAAHAACRTDRRARAGVNFDGTLWDFAAAGDECPAAFLDIGADAALALPQLAALAGVTCPAGSGAIGRANDVHFADCRRRDVVRIEIAGTTHGDFTDRPLVDSLAAGGGMPVGCAGPLVNRLCRTFLDWTLKGEGPGAFEAAIADEPRIRRLPAQP